jgi:hypothetical protein
MEELLDGLRPRAFAIASRMLGGVSEAEDVVHEAGGPCTRRSTDWSVRVRLSWIWRKSSKDGSVATTESRRPASSSFVGVIQQLEANASAARGQLARRPDRGSCDPGSQVSGSVSAVPG